MKGARFFLTNDARLWFDVGQLRQRRCLNFVLMTIESDREHYGGKWPGWGVSYMRRWPEHQN